MQLDQHQLDELPTLRTAYEAVQEAKAARWEGEGKVVGCKHADRPALEDEVEGLQQKQRQA